MKPLISVFIFLGPAVLFAACNGNSRLIFAEGNGGAGGAGSATGGGGGAGGAALDAGPADGGGITTSAASSSGAGLADAGYDGAPYVGPCGPWTVDQACHQGPPPFVLNCSTDANCAPFAHCQHYQCRQSDCCFWVDEGAPVTCGASTCMVDADCGNAGKGSSCVDVACVNGQCVGKFTGQCCQP